MRHKSFSISFWASAVFPSDMCQWGLSVMKKRPIMTMRAGMMAAAYMRRQSLIESLSRRMR